MSANHLKSNPINLKLLMQKEVYVPEPCSMGSYDAAFDDKRRTGPYIGSEDMFITYNLISFTIYRNSQQIFTKYALCAYKRSPSTYNLIPNLAITQCYQPLKNNI